MGRDDEERIRQQVEAAYHRSGPPSTDARRSLLERIGRLPPPRHERVGWARLAVGHTPAPARLAIAAAVILVASAALIVRALDPHPDAPDGTGRSPAAPAGSAVVSFELTAPAAARVTLVGDFNGWDRQATPMRRASASDIWSVSVPVARGRHAYGFVVDGERWVADPSAPLAPEDGFGGANSVIVVGGPGPS